MPSPALIGLVLVNKFPNKLAPNVLSKITQIPPFCSFASFWIVLLMFFINKPDSSTDLTVFMTSLISSFEIINVVPPGPNIFLWIAASVAEAATVNPNGIETLLNNGLSTFSINENPVFKVYLEILLTVLFYAFKYFLILY